MSVAVNIKGRKRSDINASLRAHQIRQNEKDAKKILKDTASQIDPKLSSMNKNYFDDPERLQEMRDKIDVISDKRREAGGKKVYKSANVFMVGTLQIGDDSLEALGWKFDKDGVKLPADQQSDRALKNVELVYDDMVQSVKKQPEIYGDIFSATLHMDEGSPHVDFMSDPLDTEKPDRLARHFLNGPKGTPRGHNLSVMQDNIMKHSRFKEETIERFGLVRGDGESKRLNTARELRAEDKELKRKRKSLTSEIVKAKSQLNSFQERLQEQKEENKKEKKKIKEVKEKQSIRGRKLDDRETLLNQKADTIKDEKEALEDSKKVLQELTRRVSHSIEVLVDKIKKGIIRPEEVIEAKEETESRYSPYDETNPEHVEAMADTFESLANFSEDDLKDLEDDSKQL